MAVQDNIKIGDIYNRLKVIELPYKNENKRWYVLCECTCDNHIIKPIRVDSLVGGDVKSCGCLLRENAKKQGKLGHKTNKYDLTGEYGIGYTSNYNEHNENFFYFDLEDYDKIKDYCWCFDKDGYLMTMIKKKNVKMHRLIMNCPKELEVDHIKHREDGSGTENDNRKFNLRICKHYQNCANRKYRKNVFGCQGVGFKNGLWYAHIQVNGKDIFLGEFSQYEDAVKARKTAEDMYQGEFSYDNSMAI